MCVRVFVCVCMRECTLHMMIGWRETGCSGGDGLQYQYSQCDGILGGVCYVLRFGISNLVSANAQCILLGGRLTTAGSLCVCMCMY